MLELKTCKISTPFFLVMSIILITFFAIILLQLADIEQNIANHPQVIDLHKNKIIKTKVKFGNSPACEKGECWLDTNFDDYMWEDIHLSITNIRQMPDFDYGVQTGYIYYRININVPDESLIKPYNIAFSPGVIDHEIFEVYAEGQLIYEGQGWWKTKSSVIIPIAQHLLINKKVNLTIKASLTPSDVGILHKGGIYLGPHEILDRLFSIERQTSTFYIVFALMSGCIFCIFSLLFVFTQKAKGHSSFLIYALCTTLEPILVGDFLIDYIPFNICVIIFFSCRVISTFMLLDFLLRFMETNWNMRWFYPTLILTLIATFIASWDYGYGSHRTTIEHMFIANNYLLVTATFIGLSRAINLVRQESKIKIQSRQLDPKNATSKHSSGDTHHYNRSPLESLTLVFMLAIFAAVACWETFLAAYWDTLYSQLFDLAFFIFVAVCVTRDLGRNEKLLEQKTLELATLKVDRGIAQATQMLAHDVRAPFGTLRMIVDALSDEGFHAYDELRHVVIPSLLQRIDHAESLISDILSASSRASLNCTAVNMEEFIHSTLNHIFAPAKGYSVELSYQFSCLHDVAIDRVQMERVVTNIVTNALQAMKGKGRIWFRSMDVKRQDQSFVQLSIGNSGSYIDAEARAQVFETFYTQGKATGTGLGLAIAKKIVLQHGGEIWCTSDKDLGTEFHLTLPVAKRSAKNALIRHYLPRFSHEFPLLHKTTGLPTNDVVSSVIQPSV